MLRRYSYKISDVSGVELEPATGRTIRFSYDGLAYSIDLTNEEASEFETAIDRWVQAASRIGGRRSAPRAGLTPG